MACPQAFSVDEEPEDPSSGGRHPCSRILWEPRQGEGMVLQAGSVEEAAMKWPSVYGGKGISGRGKSKG